MTVPSSTNRISFAGDGSTLTFNTTPVKFFTSADLSVLDVVDATGVATTLALTTDYSVTGGGTGGAVGSVVMVAAPASGHTLVIVRRLSVVQLADFVNNDNSDADVVEATFDKLTMMVQQNATDISRSLVFDDGFTGTFDATIPSDVLASPGASLIINATGDAFAIGPTASAISAAETNAVAAAAQAAAASVQATAAAASATSAAATLGKFKVSTTDTTLGFLSDKVTAGAGITITTTNPSANATQTVRAVGALVQVQYLTSGSTLTVSATTNKIRVYLIGGGGGVAGIPVTTATACSVGGGGAGAEAEKVFTVTPSGTYAYTIGAGGTAGATAASSTGGTGGTTTLVVSTTTVSATGGGGGASSATSATATVGPPGAGGTATNADKWIRGQQGLYGFTSGTNIGVGGAGGSTRHGWATAQGQGGVSAIGSNVYGAGASGAWQASNGGTFAGTAGAPGLIIVEEFS